MRILIAEDNRVLADVIQFNLEAEGFDVSVAHNGQAALALAKRQSFDLIFSDYQMPGLSGEEMLRAIRGASACQDAMCVLCSAMGYELDERQLIEELDLLRIILKPFSPNELVEIAHEAQAGLAEWLESRAVQAART